VAKFVGGGPLASDHCGLAALRASLVSGVALVILAGSVGSADAQSRRYYRYYGNPYYQPNYQAPAPAVVTRRAPAAPAGAHSAAAAQPPVKKPNPEKDGFPDVPKAGTGGVLQIAVSIGSQRLTLYHDGVRVAQAPVSTGTASHPTPMGVFSVIEKDRFHRSNLYGNAPMFFMQRVTWSGVAMHEGALPGYAASHGCIRLPTEFAARLWPTTKMGVRVVISREDLHPVDFAHPALFVPKAKPAEPKVAMNPSTDGLGGSAPIVLAQAIISNDSAQAIAAPAAKAGPEALEEAKASGFAGVPVQTTKPAEPMKAAEAPAKPADEQATGTVTLSRPADAAAPAMPSELRKSVEVPAAPATPAAAPVEATPPGGEAVKPAPTAEPPKPVAPRTRLSDQPAKRGGQVAVFVSRKEKKIFVRQGFIPVFEMPITIDGAADQPLGTHVFTAMAFTDNGAGMRWNLITVPNEPRPLGEPEQRRKSKEPPKPVHMKPPSSAAEALNRIQMPKEVAERIGEMLIPGSSLIVSDEGLGRETGRMTEFIVLTR
jgi:lipoprotein-anchoring transpeptidase ErfK/SrfK